MGICNLDYTDTSAWGCPCACHTALNNIGGCNHCNCKPVYGSQMNLDLLTSKVKFLEDIINNAIRRINNAQTDIKELMLRVSKLEK